MRHRKSGVKLGRTSSHRKAMFRNMVTSLIKHERINTTDAKAKELRKWVDNVITLAKRGDLHARRQALAIIKEKDVVHKLFEEAPERYASVSGGYTRITKIGLRAGDAAPMSIIELIDHKTVAKKKTKKKPVVKTEEAPKPVEEPSAEKAEEKEEAVAAVQETEADVEASEETVDDAEATEETPEDDKKSE